GSLQGGSAPTRAPGWIGWEDLPNRVPPPLPPRRPRLVPKPPRRADPAPARGLAARPRREERPRRRAHRLGQDPRRVPLRDRQPVRAGPRAPRRDAGGLRLAAARALERRAEEPPGAARGDPRARPRPSRAASARAHWRYEGLRADRDDEAAAPHPGHDPGVALPAAHLRGRPDHAADDPDRYRRRDPRPRARQEG